MSRNIFDELGPYAVYEELKRRMAFNKVGDGFGQTGWIDEQIRHALHGSRKTFHTGDSGYYKPAYCHSTYCLVYYDVKDSELAFYIRRFLRHPQFNTHRKRLGKVVKVTKTHIEFWEVGRHEKVKVDG
jgi:hypothetical protein